ncbi:MAG: Dabb family protein [Clostridiales bacterium]|nr:Dabb family protein [Clostridiales bacterium]
MVNHIVLWNFKPELSKEEREEAGNTIRKNLEAVKAQVTGVVSLEVVINELDSSNKDLGLVSVFESVEALNAYQVHPAHVQAGAYIKTVTCDRVCLDYES